MNAGAAEAYVRNRLAFPLGYRLSEGRVVHHMLYDSSPEPRFSWKTQGCIARYGSLVSIALLVSSPELS